MRIIPKGVEILIRGPGFSYEARTLGECRMVGEALSGPIEIRVPEEEMRELSALAKLFGCDFALVPFRRIQNNPITVTVLGRLGEE